MTKKKGVSEKVAKSPHRRRKATKISLLAILSVIAIFLCVVAGYSISYAKKTYANVYLGETYLGGKNKQQVADIVKSKSESFLQQKFVLNYKSDNQEDKKFEIIPSDTGLVFDVDKTVEEVYGYGRNGKIFNNFSNQFVSLFKPKKFNAIYTINEEALGKKVKDIADEVDTPEKDYEIEYSGNEKFHLLKDRQTGKRIEQDKIKDFIKKEISHLKMTEFSFESQVYEPKVSLENAESILAAANNILDEGELKLVYSELNFSLDIDTIGGIVKSKTKGDTLELYIDQAKTMKQIEVIATNINRDPKNATLQATDGKVSAFQLSQDGRKLENEQTVVDIGNALLARSVDGVTGVDTKKVTLKVAITQPDVTSEKLDSYGLRELVATGTTNFKGSPSNRVHNITVGANAISGTLLKPGETFSTLGKLGAIDASTGYLPELVIKENQTTPEYGGGLCQVSTTLFRAALNAGMEIVSRSNHKYRVSYYEPPVGMDATIYDPAPDFKFKNNYNSYILIQASVVGTKITFDFYGTKDARVIEIGNSEMYDIAEPGPAVEVTTDTLAPGERKQLEKAHQGCSAKFHYKVSKDGNVLQEKDFVSKYVAWPEKWLVGVEVTPPATETPAPAETPAATETPTE